MGYTSPPVTPPAVPSLYLHAWLASPHPPDTDPARVVGCRVSSIAVRSITATDNVAPE